MMRLALTLTLTLSVLLCAGCESDTSGGETTTTGGGETTTGGGETTTGGGETTDPCDDCPTGSWCEGGECVYDRGDGHYDCGGGAYCFGGEIVVNPVSDAPDAEDPCAPDIIPCEHGCDEGVWVDEGNPESACRPHAPCSPEALGLEGTPVDFTVLTLTCAEGDPEPEPAEGAEPEPLVIATSAEALAEALGPCTTSEVGFETQRVAVIRGWSENAPDEPTWVLDVDGTIHIEVTVQPFSSGIEVLPEPYTLAIALPAGDTPVTADPCHIPYEGPEVP